MRQLVVLNTQPIWAVCCRELVSPILVGPWLLYQTLRKKRQWSSGRAIGQLILTGLLIQIVGNVCNQWAMGVVGLAVTTPAIYGAVIVSGAILGWIWLGERVSPRSLFAIVVLLIALTTLGLGVAESAGSTTTDIGVSHRSLWMLLLGVAAGGTAGGVYAVLNIVIRHNVTQTTSPVAVSFWITLMGVSLAPWSIHQYGWGIFTNTSLEQYGLMAGAGVFNLLGFLFLIYGLQRISVVYANAMSASQVAMSALSGIVLFHEPPNRWLVLGIALTIIGIVRFDHPAEGGGV
jgi:drug/metabolite transporter (DMT)-like permease